MPIFAFASLHTSSSSTQEYTHARTHVFSLSFSRTILTFIRKCFWLLVVFIDAHSLSLILQFSFHIQCVADCPLCKWNHRRFSQIRSIWLVANSFQNNKCAHWMSAHLYELFYFMCISVNARRHERHSIAIHWVVSVT